MNPTAQIPPGDATYAQAPTPALTPRERLTLRAVDRAGCLTVEELRYQARRLGIVRGLDALLDRLENDGRIVRRSHRALGVTLTVVALTDDGRADLAEIR